MLESIVLSLGERISFARLKMEDIGSCRMTRLAADFDDTISSNKRIVRSQGAIY